MTRTLMIYVNHPENGDPNEMTEALREEAMDVLSNFFTAAGLGHWTVESEFEDEG